MLTKEFAYNLPPELIATQPTQERTQSRLLVVDRVTGALHDRQFTDLYSFLRTGDMLVLNDTKVIKARLFGRKETGGKIEVLIERILSDNTAWAHIRASKIPKPGSWLVLANAVRAQVQEFNPEKGLFLLSFHYAAPLNEILDRYGEVPLPPYMNRAAASADTERYQTVYAQSQGSVAAPTAGLHFSAQMLESLQASGITIGRLTLHVGAGTFQQVRVADISQHKMHSERFTISEELCAQVNQTKQRGGRVIAVGTTSVRALESAAKSGALQPLRGETDIFITPGFKFNVVDCMVTNFHLPESTLLMLICAFASKEKVFAAYQHAIAQKYRFYSYGDAMFITGDRNEQQLHAI